MVKRMYARTGTGSNKKPLSNLIAGATQSKGAVLSGTIVESPGLSSAMRWVIEAY